MGILTIDDALQKADEFGLDLVELQPNAEPPVVKILDYGKYKYQAQKRASEARKKQKVIDVKEIKLRPNIDSHDYDVKMRSVRKFLESGDKVKITLRFRGREMAHVELGSQLLERVREDIEEEAKHAIENNFLNTKKDSDGLQFISVQKNAEQLSLDGFWMLKDIGEV